MCFFFSSSQLMKSVKGLHVSWAFCCCVVFFLICERNLFGSSVWGLSLQSVCDLKQRCWVGPLCSFVKKILLVGICVWSPVCSVCCGDCLNWFEKRNICLCWDWGLKMSGLEISSCKLKSCDMDRFCCYCCLVSPELDIYMAQANAHRTKCYCLYWLNVYCNLSY